MAKTTKPRAAKAATRGKMPAKAAKAPKKAARKPASAKAPAAKAKAAKAAKPAARTKPRKDIVESSAMPEHAASKAAARRAVARPTKAHHEAQMEKADHDHQDPRLSGVGGAHAEPSKVQAFNYGQFKNKAMARLDKPVNWFRRAPRQKQ